MSHVNSVEPLSCGCWLLLVITLPCGAVMQFAEFSIVAGLERRLRQFGRSSCATRHEAEKGDRLWQSQKGNPSRTASSLDSVAGRSTRATSHATAKHFTAWGEADECGCGLSETSRRIRHHTGQTFLALEFIRRPLQMALGRIQIVHDPPTLVSNPILGKSGLLNSY